MDILRDKNVQCRHKRGWRSVFMREMRSTLALLHEDRSLGLRASYHPITLVLSESGKRTCFPGGLFPPRLPRQGPCWKDTL